MPKQIFEYDVALSFAGEDRPHAQALAERLRARGLGVFYDEYEKASLWGKDLYVHLHEVYSQRARFCVLFASRAYAQKVWTSHERQAAQERALREKGREYILPIRIDDTTIPGVASTIGYLNIDEGIGKISETLVEKIASLGAILGPPPEDPSPLVKPQRKAITRLDQVQPLALPRSQDVVLTLDYTKVNITQKLHHYRLVASFKNIGKKRFDDWEVEVEFPTPLLEPHVIIGAAVKEHSNEQRTLVRTGSASFGRLRPGDKREVTFGYRVDETLYHARRDLFEEPVMARAFIDGELAAEVSRPVSELECF